MSQPQKYLTPAEFASITRVSDETVRRQIRQGQIPAIKVGRSVRIPADAFAKLGQRDALQRAKTHKK